MTEQTEKRAHFIRQLIIDDLANGKHQGIVTRFPPEPNGYLHVGHAKSICLNFGLAEEFKGKCFLRFDDTNPIKEEEEYVNAIIDDVRWLGFEWCAMTHSSDYYHELYELAIYLIKKDMAYVDSLSMEEIRAFRGTLQEPGRESPYRNRTIEENLDLFARMKAGDFPDGTHVLRAKIDMKSGNLNMRDPVLYRIRHARHQRTGDE
ncbi:glutamate--tRNA ligase family protein, partial [Legionella pneumophila serogroup 1]